MKPITCHFLEAAHRPSTAIAFRYKLNRIWTDVSWQEYYLRVEQLAHALQRVGVQKGDRVAICANTRWEWACLDFAILGLGAITVPIYQSSLAEEIRHIINDCKPTVLFLENASQFKKWKSVQKECSSVKSVILIEGAATEDVSRWDAFFARGENPEPGWFKQSLESAKLEDVASIVYTSGTSGNPKGVVLTHTQIVSEMLGAVQAFNISTADVSLCFLPFSHVLGRLEMWLSTYSGFTLCFAESIERMQSNLREIKPTVLIGVPRIFEKIFAAVLAQTEGHPIRKAIFDFSTMHIGGLRGLLLSLPQRIIAEKLIYKNIRQALGGRLRFAVSGGAPLAPEIGQFFYKAGILLLEGYGLTETSGAVFANTPEAFRFGTVGRAFDDVKIKIADDGEILIKSQKVMKEYCNDPEGTQATMTEGYFHTGDIGELSSDGYLRITDRKKDLIKTSGGKYVAPQKIENLLKLNPLVSNVLVHGDQKKYIVALVTLDEGEVKRLKASGRGSPDQLQGMVRDFVKAANAHLASYETIKNFAILPHDFTVESGELTPSLKLKRKVANQNYKSIIESLY